MAHSTFITLDKKGRATLPEEVRTALGVSAGEFILMEPTRWGTFELVPATLVPKDQLWFHHPEMQARVSEAEEDFAQGRSTRTETPAEAQEFLDRLKSASPTSTTTRRVSPAATGSSSGSKAVGFSSSTW